MNSEAFMDEFISKPKINRLPPHIASKNPYDKQVVESPVAKWSFILMGLLTVLAFGYRYMSSASDDARLLALITSTDEVIKPRESSLYFKDNEGMIAGQMVKIAPDSDKAGVVATPVGQERDKYNERELLSIVGKY